MSLLTSDIVTYNASVMYNVLNNLALMFNDASFKSLIGLSLSTAVAWYMVSNAQAGENAKSITHLLFATIFIGCFVLLKGNVIVRDQSLNQGREVQKLPLVITLVGGYVSQVADSITRAYETHFKVPDDSFRSFSKYGTLFGAKILDEASKQEIRSPRLTHNMNQFMAQCIIPDIRIKARYTLEDLVESTNPWDVILKNTSPLRGFEYYAGKGTGYPKFKICREGAKLLDADLQKEAKKQMQELGWNLGSRFGFSKKDGRQKAAVANRAKSYMLGAIKTQLSSAHEFFLEASGESFDILKQHMMRNYLINMPENYAVMKGATSAAQAYGLARARLMQKNSMWISSALSPDNLLRLYTVLQALIYAALPIIVLLLPFHIGFNALKMYIGVLVWVHSWPIFFAIINYIQNESLYTSLSSAAQTIVGNGDNQSVISGWTIMNSPAISNANLDVSQTAAMLTASVPFISLIIVRGASQAVHVASNWFAKGEGAAVDTGTRITDGNIDGGNLNMQNRIAFNESMNHHNTKASYAGVGANMELSSGSQLGITGQGGHVLNQTTGMSQTSANFRLADSISRSFTEQSQQALNTMQTNQVSYAESLGTASMSAYNLGESGTISTSSGENYGVNQSSGFTQHYDDVKRLTQDFAKRFSMNEMQASRLLFGANACIKAGFDSSEQSMGKVLKMVSGFSAKINGGAEVNDTYSTDTVADTQVAQALNYVKDTNMGEKIDSMLRASKDITNNENSNYSDSLTSTLSSSLDELSRSSNDYNTSIQEYNSVSEAAQLSKTQSANVDFNMQQFLLEKVSAMHDDNGNVIGTARADAILRNQPEAELYVDEVVRNHREEMVAGYKSKALSKENIVETFNSNADTIAQKKDDLHVAHEARCDAYEQIALQKGVPLVKDAINHDAEKQYHRISNDINADLQDLTNNLEIKGEAHAEKVREERDQDKRGLIRRTHSNVTKNVGGRKQDD